MDDKILYSIVFIISVFLSSISQILLKKSAKKIYDRRLEEYLNPLVIFSYGLFFICTLITIIAYKKIPLSLGPILESTGYIYVSILGAIFLGEKFSKKKLSGMLFIILGIIIFSI